MLTFFYGNDTETARLAWRVAAKAARAGAVYQTLEPDNFTLALFEELAASQDIFGQKLVVSVDGILTSAEWRERLIAAAIWSAAAASATAFYWWEENLPPAVLRQLAELPAGGVVFKEFVGPTKSKFDFDASALPRRDRRGLWLAYQRALRQGLSAEEIFWRLTWQVKNLFTAKRPAVFGPGDLERLSSGLVALWHDTHRLAGRDLALSLERWILMV